MEKNLEAVKVSFNSKIEEVYAQGFEDGQKTVVEQYNKLDELHVARLVRFIGTDADKYNYLTPGKVYKVLEKTIHAIDQVPVLKIVDDRQLDETGSLVRPNTVRLFEKVAIDETIEHNGLMLRKVERKVREGDYIRQNSDTKSDMILRGVVYGPVDEQLKVKGRDGFHYRIYPGDERYNRTKDTVEVFEVVKSIELQDEPTEEPVPIKSQNEQRGELLYEADKFIRSLKYKESYFLLPTKTGVGIEVFASFIVDKENRTVTCTLKNRYQNHTCKRETARCHPNDVFNARLGKLISLSMCLGNEVPEKFLHAVQPTEFVIGQRFKYGTDQVYIVTAIEGNKALVDDTDCYAMLMDFKDYKVIDDTNAEYGHGE